MKKKCGVCGEPSIPGLIPGWGLCQYHWNVKQFGKEWADKCRAEEYAAPEEGKETVSQQP